MKHLQLKRPQLKRPQLKKLSRRHVIGIIIIAVPAVVIATAAFFLSRQVPVTLSPEYYAATAAIDIDKDQYNQLIKDEQSFVVMVDNPGCTTTARMREFLNDLPAEQQFVYYRIMWQDAKDTTLHQYIKYFPSIAIIDHGRMAYYLRADHDADSNYYNNAPDLYHWLETRIKFN